MFPLKTSSPKWFDMDCSSEFEKRSSHAFVFEMSVVCLYMGQLLELTFDSNDQEKILRMYWARSPNLSIQRKKLSLRKLAFTKWVITKIRNVLFFISHWANLARDPKSMNLSKYFDIDVTWFTHNTEQNAVNKIVQLWKYLNSTVD